MLKLGFTGTRSGMTAEQTIALTRVFVSLDCALVIEGLDPVATEFHYGDCEGADYEAFELARVFGLRTVSHPPIDAKARAFTKADEVLPAREYIARNHDIVDVCGMLIATPKGDERVRSGTWATIRYARKFEKSVVIIRPSGSVRMESKGEKL